MGNSLSAPPRPAESSHRLANALRQAIAEGKYPQHSAFPSFRELSLQHGVSLRVVKAALDILEKEGVLYRRERRGTFVRGAGAAWPDGDGRCPLRCVNLVERPGGTVPGFERAGYLVGCTQALERHDIKMRFVRCPPEGGYEAIFAPDVPYAEQGCVLINIITPSLLRWLSDHAVPFVVQSSVCYDLSPLPPHHSLSVNKVGAAFAATQHLIGLGHRRIGFIGRPEHTSIGPGDFGEIYEGYRAALRCAGVEERACDLLDFAANEAEVAVEPARRYLSRRDLPTAVVAQTDATAIGVLRAAKELGVRVPRDLSVIGYNDETEAEQADPPLTTMSNQRVLLGRTAVEMVIAAASGAYDAPQNRVLQCPLVERQTTAPPCREARMKGEVTS